MRIKKIISLIMCLVLSGLLSSVVTADSQHFYFESGEFDYYINKTDNGDSEMRVEETLTAVFPETDQNHGIERCLPVNYGGAQSLDVGSFTAARNGSPENSSYYWSGDQVCFRIGDADGYVHGEQTYVLQYNEKNIIDEQAPAARQRFYWNTNGTRWSQRFNRLVARVHLTGETSELFDGSTECYVGPYGASGEAATSRCTISKMIDNTITFKTSDAAAGENMTILVYFQPGSFGVKESEVDNPEPVDTVESIEDPPILEDIVQTQKDKPGTIDGNLVNIIICICIITGVTIMMLAFAIAYLYYQTKYRQRLPKVIERTSPMEYVPPSGLSVAEATLIYNYLGKPSNTAVILELALKGKIALVAVKKVRKKLFTKREDHTINWNIKVKNLDGVKPYQYAVLMALNKNAVPKVGDTLEIGLQEDGVSSRAALLGNAAEDTVNILAEKKLLKKGAKQKDPYPMWIISCQVLSGIGLIFVLVYAAGQFFGATANAIMNMAWLAWLMGVAGIGGILFVVCILPFIYNKILEKRTLVKFYTEDGIKTKLYLNGLYKYMKLAEAEKIRFLQSVPGADISDKGIVKLYEKLLPYAVIFGLESTWLAELEHYYQSASISGPSWAADGGMIDYVDLGNLCAALSMYVGNSQGGAGDYGAGDFGGGGDSGGGGFSGGGGGGGGGGGW